MRIIALALGLVSVAVAAVASHPYSVRDTVTMDRLSTPRVSPDGQQVAFVVRSTDLAANAGRYDLWRVGIVGGEAERLTTDAASDTNPIWSNDGSTLYFLSTRSGSSQIWRLPASGGEAQPVSRLPLDVANLILSPNGKWFAFSLEVFPDCPSATCTAERLKKDGERQASGRIYDRLMVRHWDHWRAPTRQHVFVAPVPAKGALVDVGALRNLTSRFEVDIPSTTWGGAEEFAFTPDSKSVVFTAKDARNDEAWSTDFDLFLVSIDGSAKPKNLTDGNPGADTGPVFSPDGKTLAYRFQPRPQYESDRFHIALMAWPGGERRELAADWDVSADLIVFAPDSKSVLVTAHEDARQPLFRIDVATGRASKLVAGGSVAEPQPTKDRIVYGLHHLRSPTELYSVDGNGQNAKKLTGFNDRRLADVRFGEPESFAFPGWNDEPVQAWAIRPANFDPKRKYPIALLIHGGPQQVFGDDFHYRWNPEAFAGAGYAVLSINFHGSPGWGQAFTDSIRDDWGGKPFVDIQKGLAAAVARYPWMDGARATALGASYGGFMINWIAGNWPDRFRCLVNHSGNLDERMAYFDTEELWFGEWEHRGTPWENPEGYRKHNPIDHVDKWKTPMLLVHGALDYRVVDTQGLATFTALQRRGIPSQLLSFPDEDHWIQKPANSIQWYETVIAWLDRWTK